MCNPKPGKRCYAHASMALEAGENKVLINEYFDHVGKL